VSQTGRPAPPRASTARPDSPKDSKDKGPAAGTKRRLDVLVDGKPIPEAEALGLWERFSLWMDEHRGDLQGFAAREGFKSVHPGVSGGNAVLNVSSALPQKPYSAVKPG
jgi:hypothetical protein